ncbi:MAG: FIST C-terminal domain-containing protein [Cellvibrio sp.]
MNQVINRGAKSLMILSCSANNHSDKHLFVALRNCLVPICGGIFPSVFFADKKLDAGFIILGFPFSVFVSSYSLTPLTNELQTPELWDGEIPVQSRDLLVFVDAMANATEIFISKLFERIGGGINVIGGGAGAIDFIQRPCIFSNAGLIMATALVVQLPVPMQCAVEHGWEILSGPYLVTESKGAKVKTINYEPAFDIYKSLVEKITEYKFAGNNFFEISKNFPLGILGIHDDILVRDPIQSLNSELFCVGSVPVNSMIYILSGNANRLISAAENAGLMAYKESSKKIQESTGLAIVFDCVSRALYLGESFSLELAAIQRGLGSQRTIVGALSIGEIANTSRGTINLLNKSIVVGNL